MQIYGKQIREALKERIRQTAQGISMKMVVIQVGDDQPSQVYVNNIRRFGEEVGVAIEIYNLPASVQQSQVEELIRQLNNEPDVTGIMIQTPLPEHLNTS